MRRLGILLGGSAPAAATTVGAFMAGLGLGGLAARRLRGVPARWYAALEASAALWALLFPWLLHAVNPWLLAVPGLKWPVAVLLLVIPAIALGATWPLLAASVPPVRAAGLYAVNTAGAVAGVLGAAFLLLPMLGVRGTECTAAVLGLGVAASSWRLLPQAHSTRTAVERPMAPYALIIAVTVAGAVAMGLEVLWFRLAAVALGSTVQIHALVLAVFLLTLALGAALGQHWPASPKQGLTWGLASIGILACIGALLWAQIPYVYAALYAAGGPSALLPGSVLLAVLLMGGAPAASGLAFSCAVRAAGDALKQQASTLYAANTAGAIAGAWMVGLWLLPSLPIQHTVVGLSLLAGLAATLVSRRPLALICVAVTALAVPAWDARLYAVGVHLRISDFAEPSVEAVQAFVDEGWELLFYEHGPTAAVAVGRSTRTKNTWLSINGKVDASTGADMATQRLSGTLPVRIAPRPANVLLVGLASGVTAGAILEEPGVESLTAVELEPSVVAASHYFDHVNGRPLDDPRTQLVLEDARSILEREGPLFDVIVSEPSNPWITGVSNLFTREYWEATRRRLHPDGVMCQWVQLYGMGPDEFRGLVRTFQAVYPNAWLFETVPGADALLIGGRAELPPGLPLQPSLTPRQVSRLAGEGWLNHDDHPRVEWQAPRWLHYDTTQQNADLIRATRATE